MPTSTLIRWSAPCFALGGLLFAAFILISNGEFTGAELGLSMRHHVAHLCHLASSVLFLFGIMGLYAAHRERAGMFGFLAFVVAIIGDALWVGTGVITGLVWRTISEHAPQLVDAHGAFFEPPLAIIFTATTLFALGHLLLAIMTWRARLLARGPLVAIVVGMSMTLLPPPPWGPVPYVVLDAGASLFAIGCCLLAASLLRSQPPEPAGARPRVSNLA